MEIPRPLKKTTRSKYNWDIERGVTDVDTDDSDSKNDEKTQSGESDHDEKAKFSNRLTKTLNLPANKEEIFDIIIPILRMMKNHVHQLKMTEPEQKNFT